MVGESVVQQVDGRVSSVVLLGLLNGVEYEVSVRSENESGVSAWSAVVGVTPTLGEAPEVSRLIVKYEPGAAAADAPDVASASGAGSEVGLAPGEAIGFGLRTVDLSEPVSEATAERIARDLEASPKVRAVEPDFRVSVSGPGGAQGGAAPGLVRTQGSYGIQSVAPGPPWGLDRLDQRTLPLNQTYQFDTRGEGVRAYVVDTGIRGTHAQFGGRVALGYDAVTGSADRVDSRPSNDCNGHGTHVAGIIGGADVGVAKSVTLVPVRVLDCAGSGSVSQVIDGLAWVLATNGADTAVVNISLGGMGSVMLDAAVQSVIDRGITVVIASGNDGADAANYSPARVRDAITVNASVSTDDDASWSNYGMVTDLYAPGDTILSSYFSSDTALAFMSGTSMAAPHVSGAVARLLGASPGMSPAAVQSELLRDATPVDFIPTSPQDAKGLLFIAPGTGLPSAPLAVSAAPGVGSIKVTWEYPSTSGSAPVTGYTARAFEQADGGVPVQTCSTQGRTCTILGLATNRTYYVDVVATSTEGSGDPSSPRYRATTVDRVPLEFAFGMKSENQIQYSLCKNFKYPEAFRVNLVVTVKQGSTVVPVAQYPFNPTPSDYVIQPNGYDTNCGEIREGSQTGIWNWASADPLTAGTTYTFEARMRITPVTGRPGSWVEGTPVTYVGTEFVTTGGGCPVGAPDDSGLRKAPWNGAVGLEADGRVVRVGYVVNENDVPAWVWSQNPTVVQWVPTYLWTGRTYAETGMYYDPVTKDFGPRLAVGATRSTSSLASMAGLGGCLGNSAISITVPPASADECTASASGVSGREAGSCTVNVTATRGSASKTNRTVLVVASTPMTAPGAPAVTNPGTGSSLRAAWAQPSSSGNAALQDYVVEVSTDGTAWRRVPADPLSAEPTATIAGLLNGTGYRVRVTAVNRKGETSVPVASVSYVKPTGPPRSPSIASVVAGNRQLRVSWAPWNPSTAAGLDAAGGLATTYQATATAVYRDASGRTATETKSCTALAGSCDVTGLTVGRQYSVGVRASNQHGQAAAATAWTGTVVPFGVSGPPTGVAGVPGNAQAVVAWQAPASDGGASIAGYAVTASPGGRTCTTTGALSCTVTGLANGTGYAFTVVASNAAGPSPASAVSAAVVPRTVPGVPSGVAGVPGNGSAVVSWKAPAVSGGSAVTGYVVEVSETGSGAYAVAAGCAASSASVAVSCVATGLVNGTGYAFRVAAVNAAGTSASYSAASAAVVPRTPPGAPTDVVAMPADRGASVAFNAPTSNGGSDVTNYAYSTNDGSSWTVRSPASTASPLVITGLAYGTEYKVRVRAVNAAGAGVASNGIAVVTLSALPASPAIDVSPGIASLGVRFTRISFGQAGGVAVGYVAEARVGTAVKATCSVPQASEFAGDTGCVLSGLVNGQEYSISAVARNARGDSARVVSSASAIQRTPRAGGTVSGKVTAGGNGGPLAGVRVVATSLTGDNNGAVTGADGRYSMLMISGRYRIYFGAPSDSNYGSGYFPNASPSIWMLMDVTGGSVTANTDVALPLGGAISGIVTDPDGKPAPYVSVSAYSGFSQYESSVRSGADGRYRIQGLNAGNHQLFFNPYADDSLAWELYEDTRNWSQATNVNVTVGNNTVGIDARLDRGGSISGTVRGPSGAPVANVNACATSGHVGWCVLTDIAGRYVLRNQAAGTYTVAFKPSYADSARDPGLKWMADEYWNGARVEGAATLVEVTPGGVTNGIDARLESAGGISGRVTQSGGTALGGVLVHAEGPMEAWATSRADGSYALASLIPGEYAVSFLAYDGTGGYREGSAARVAATVTAGATRSGADASFEATVALMTVAPATVRRPALMTMCPSQNGPCTVKDVTGFGLR